MERWTGKVAVVTGASAGIGAAITLDLIKSGMIVIGLARRPEKVMELKNQLPDSLATYLNAYKCDVGIEDDVNKAFNWIEQQFGGVDVLINNAGIAASTNLLDDGNTNLLKSIIDTNVLGIILCTRKAFQSMKKRGVDGHVLLINSTLGQNLGGVTFNKSFNVYPATKYAVTALTETYRQEFMELKSKTKISSISPGWVETDIITPENIKSLKEAGYPFMMPEDISQAALYILSTPPHVQVHELLIKPVGEKYL